MLGRITYFNHYDRFKKAILPYIAKHTVPWQIGITNNL